MHLRSHFGLIYLNTRDDTFPVFLYTPLSFQLKIQLTTMYICRLGVQEGTTSKRDLTVRRQEVISSQCTNTQHLRIPTFNIKTTETHRIFTCKHTIINCVVIHIRRKLSQTRQPWLGLQAHKQAPSPLVFHSSVSSHPFSLHTCILRF